MNCHRSCAAPSITVKASAVVHSADQCSMSMPPCRLAKSDSPAQNEGSSGVIGDCSVAKKSAMSGSDSTRSRRSGWMKRNTRIRPTAKINPVSISTSRARRAGKTLTMSSVTAAPTATGIAENGAMTSTAVA